MIKEVEVTRVVEKPVVVEVIKEVEVTRVVKRPVVVEKEVVKKEVEVTLTKR